MIDDTLPLAEQAGAALLAGGQTLAVAESCTGGLLGSLITAVPGSSAYFLGGAIAYADDAKVRLLGVYPGLIAQYGAVSHEVALAMAQGAREALGSTLALSITGVAGPGGGTLAKPAGTTYVALAAADFERVEHRVWAGDREENRRLSARLALQMALEYSSERAQIEQNLEGSQDKKE